MNSIIFQRNAYHFSSFFIIYKFHIISPCIQCITIMQYLFTCLAMQTDIVDTDDFARLAVLKTKSDALESSHLRIVFRYMCGRAEINPIRKPAVSQPTVRAFAEWKTIYLFFHKENCVAVAHICGMTLYAMKVRTTIGFEIVDGSAQVGVFV